jgi:tryptophan-rich sensory protein
MRAEPRRSIEGKAIVHHRPELEPKKTSGMHPAIALLLLLLASYAVSFISNEAERQGLQGVFLTLQKPAFAPPLWLFTPACTILFGLVGLAGWQVWRSFEAPSRSLSLGLFGLVLVLSLLWAWLLFALARLPLAFFVILALAVAMVLLVLMFARIAKAAAWLVLPYLLWVAFNLALTFSYWRLNPTSANPHSGMGVPPMSPMAVSAMNVRPAISHQPSRITQRLLKRTTSST